MMARFGVEVVLVAMFAVVATRVVVGSGFSCACTTSECANDGWWCRVNGNDSCFRIAVQVDVDDRWNSSGCGEDHPLDPALDFSLTIMIIRQGLAYVGISQCAYNACNSDQNAAGRWSNVGVVKGGCDLLDLNTSLISVHWNKAGAAISNFSDWCPNCTEKVRTPEADESLCEWVRSVRNDNYTHPTKKHHASEHNAAYLYVGAGILAAVFLIAAVLALVEFVKARKLKRSKPASGAKKKLQKEIKLASPLMPYVTLEPLPRKEAGKETAKEPAAAVGKESAPGSDATGKSPTIAAKDASPTKAGSKESEAAVKGKASVKSAK